MLKKILSEAAITLILAILIIGMIVLYGAASAKYQKEHTPKDHTITFVQE